MPRIFRHTAFLTIIFFITFALVASNGIAHQQKVINTAQFPNCLIGSTVPCIEAPKPTIFPTPNTPFTPNPELNEQQRFFAAIEQKLTIIPQPDFCSN